MTSNITFHINRTCPLSLLWDPSMNASQQPTFDVGIVAIVTHCIFWLQLVFCASVRQKAMQWLYAYLITDIVLLFRFFFTFAVHTLSKECIPNRIWSLSVCYFEAFVDTYLNVAEVYILLALNICRYIQVVHNRNVYTRYLRSLICTHFGIYLIPLIIFIVQLHVDWARVISSVGDSCYISYMNLYAKVFNTIIAFVLPISLNILVICLSVRYIHLTSRLRRNNHHVSAREKYDRSLVIQFLVFYIIWLLLWSPNVVVYQFTYRSDLLRIVRLLSFILIVIDPIIVGALDVRFWKIWKDLWRRIKNRYFQELLQQRRQIQPVEIKPSILLPQL